MQRSIEALRRLNVGSGPHHAREDWWNVDIRDFPAVDQVLDVTERWPFEGLDLVYAEHFLEHLAPRGALAFLTNALGALRVGGAIRLSTPGLEWVVRTHFTFEDDPEKQRLQTFATNRAFHGWGHQFLYSRATLEWVLSGVGFSQVEFFDYGESHTPEFVGIERHGGFSKSSGFPSVWVVEARRGPDAAPDPALAEAFTEHFIRYVESGH
jgi:predicted SAM-dependent methyltransferase